MTEFLQLDRIGRFRVKPVEWYLREAASGAVGVAITYEVMAKWNDGDNVWDDWSEYGPYRVEGTVWVVKKDGGVNKSGVDQFAGSLGWDGSMAVFYGPVPRFMAQVTVTMEEYKGQVDYRADWLRPADASVISGGGVDSARGRELNTRFGSLLRAAASSSTPPSTPAPTPKAAEVPTPTPTPKEPPPEDGEPGDDLPF